MLGSATNRIPCIGCNLVALTMASTSLPVRSILLDLPAELVGQILSYDDSAAAVERLWKSGCKAIRSVISRHVEVVRLRSNNDGTTFELPSYLKSLAGLRELQVYTPYRGNIPKQQYLSVLRSLPSSLEVLQLDFEDDATLFSPRARHYDVHPGYRGRGGRRGGRGGRGGGAGRGGRGGGGGGREQAGNEEDSDDDADEPTVEEFLASEPPFEYINLPKAFPALQKLAMNSTRGFIYGDEIALPASLTWLDCNGPDDSDYAVAWAAHLPRSITYLHTYRGSNHSKAFFEALPPSLTKMLTYLYGMMQQDLSLIPRSVQEMMNDVRWLNREIAEALPPNLRTLTCTGSRSDYDFSCFPMLKSLTTLWCNIDEDDWSGFTPDELLMLPRTLKLLHTRLATTKIQSTRLPPHLTFMSLYNFNDNIDAQFSAALPRGLLSFSAGLLPSSAAFYSQLPSGLTSLRGNIGDVESKNFSLPPGLTSLSLGAPGNSHTWYNLSDRDAWTGADAARFQPHNSERSAPKVPTLTFRPFPFHLLPQSLTELRYITRPVPISALRFFPLLNTLALGCLIDDALFIPTDPDLLERANKLRLFAQTKARRAELIANPLTSVTLLDLLPPSIDQLNITAPQKVEWERTGRHSSGFPANLLRPNLGA